MQTQTIADSKNNIELQGLVTVDRSPSGRKLKKPLTVEIKADRSIGEKAVTKYVIDAFCCKMPELISFTLDSHAVLKLATYLYRHTMGSRHTLYQYVYGAYRFFKWINENPDILLEKCSVNDQAIHDVTSEIDDFIGDLRASGLADGTISNYVKGVKAVFKANNLSIALPYRVTRRIKYPDRAPTPEELTKIIDLANIRGKVIVSLLALGGFRVGTLVELQYRHIKKDYEEGRAPIHVHVESEITKGKYSDYDTFIGGEAIEYLKAYLKAREKGTYYMSPEQIEDDSPLIRDEHSNKVRPVSTTCIHQIIHRLYIRAGLIEKNNSRRRYELRVHSIRKFFRTQLGSLGTMPVDYIEYMMGHTVSTYNDIHMKGVEFLRNLYAQSGLSIRPKTKFSKIEQLKLVVEAWGMNPNEILSREALSTPYRTVIDPEQAQIAVLNQALKSAILKELKQA